MEASALRNFKDFLLQYNRISENCFSHCVSDLSSRDLNTNEMGCVEKCAYKHVKMNNRAMQVYIDVQPAMTQKRIDEITKEAEVKATQAAEQKKVEDEELNSNIADPVVTEVEANDVAAT